MPNKNKNTEMTQCVQTDVMQSVLKASDLRIGNKLLFLGDVVTFKNITEIREDGIFFIKTFEPKIESKNFHFKPIPLTEEWLLKLDLKNIEHYCYELDNIHINTKRELMWITTKCKRELEFNIPEYVHQLQNLYFVLTGSELTVA